MSELGILIYGYNEEDVEMIKSSLNNILNTDILIFSASSLESEKVGNILDKCQNDKFEDKSVKILMFLGFNDSQINAVLKKFPQSNALKRPIFCGLTENNIEWTFQELIDDLVKEDLYWAQKRSEAKDL
jgi:hypothetical protein